MNAAIDSNSKQTITARLNTDGVTPTRITANPATSAMSVSDGTTGTAPTNNWSATDESGRTTMFAVSNDDPTVLVALQCDSTGHLFIKST